MSHAKMYAWRRSADVCPVTKGVLRWLTSSFSARARVHPISTSLKAEWVLLKSLPRVPIPLRCPTCGLMHKWDPQDAWTGDDEKRTRLSVFGSPNL
jgi:hypothetical protein